MTPHDQLHKSLQKNDGNPSKGFVLRFSGVAAQGTTPLSCFSLFGPQGVVLSTVFVHIDVTCGLPTTPIEVLTRCFSLDRAPGSSVPQNCTQRPTRRNTGQSAVSLPVDRDTDAPPSWNPPISFVLSLVLGWRPHTFHPRLSFPLWTFAANPCYDKHYKVYGGRSHAKDHDRRR